MINFLTTGGGEWLLVKAFSLVLLGIYLIFAIVVIQQVKLMSNTLHIGFEAPIKLLAYIHLVFTFLVFVAALVIL